MEPELFDVLAKRLIPNRTIGRDFALRITRFTGCPKDRVESLQPGMIIKLKGSDYLVLDILPTPKHEGAEHG